MAEIRPFLLLIFGPGKITHDTVSGAVDTSWHCITFEIFPGFSVNFSLNLQVKIQNGKPGREVIPTQSSLGSCNIATTSV